MDIALFSCPAGEGARRIFFLIDEDLCVEQKRYCVICHGLVLSFLRKCYRTAAYGYHALPFENLLLWLLERFLEIVENIC